MATLVAVVAVLPAAGLPDDALLALPGLVLLLPLLAGRYLGEDRLKRLARVYAHRARRAVVAMAPVLPRRAPVVVPRGGRLIASALAVRPPPVHA